MSFRYPTTSPLHPEALKRKQRSLREGFAMPLTLRVHRALSWLRRAEADEGDEDVRFILLWIGFNAAYAGDVGLALGGESQRERDAFARFFSTLVSFDGKHRIYDMVWQRFSQEIRVLLDNRLYNASRDVLLAIWVRTIFQLLRNCRRRLSISSRARCAIRSRSTTSSSARQRRSEGAASFISAAAVDTASGTVREMNVEQSTTLHSTDSSLTNSSTRAQLCRAKERRCAYSGASSPAIFQASAICGSASGSKASSTTAEDIVDSSSIASS